MEDSWDLHPTSQGSVTPSPRAPQVSEVLLLLPSRAGVWPGEARRNPDVLTPVTGSGLGPRPDPPRGTALALPWGRGSESSRAAVSEGPGCERDREPPCRHHPRTGGGRGARGCVGGGRCRERGHGELPQGETREDGACRQPAQPHGDFTGTRVGESRRDSQQMLSPTTTRFLGDMLPPVRWPFPACPKARGPGLLRRHS